MGTSTRHVRARLAVGLIFGLTVAGVAVAPQPAAAVPALQVPTLRWTDCGAPYECATARVPLDYDHPDGPTIALALARLPASDPAPRIGSLFVNPGGPGGSGVDLVLDGAAQTIWTPEVLARFDVVGFDPRGVGASAPIECFASDEEAAEFFSGTPLFPYQSGQVAPYIATYDRYLRRCLNRDGSIMRHLSTANVARDLDLLRRAVGDEKLTFDGASYGSFIGTVYANLFPNRVRAVVLDGVIDPVSWTTGRPPRGHEIPFSTRSGSAQGAQATFQRFIAHCTAAGPDACALAPRAGAKLDRLFAEARIGPIGGLGYDVINLLALGFLYNTRLWAPGAGFLRTVYDTAFAGDAEQGELRLPSALAGRAYDNTFDALTAVSCSDSVNPTDPYAWARATAYQERLGLDFAANWTWYGGYCATWPVVDEDRYLGPFTRRPSAPVLLVGNRYDPATPIHGARVVDELMPRTRLLTLDGPGHTSWVNSSRCVDLHVQRYLIDGRLPPVGAECDPDLRPFVDSQSAQPELAAVNLRPVPSRSR